MILGVVAVFVLFAGVASSQETSQPTAQAAMRGMFVVVSNVYKYSLDVDAFADAKNRQEILSMLEALANNADQLEAHGGGLDPSFDFMRRSLLRDAHDALAYFQGYNYVGSRFVLGKITENCVTCHTKLPAEKKFDLGQQFLDTIDTKDLTPAALANLQVATRQFADAMKTYEKTIASPDVSVADLAAYDVFENYFRISIGAMNDAKRPVPVLKEFVRRPGLPDTEKANAEVWIRSLERLNLDVAKGGELPAARRLVTDAMAETTSRSDRSRMVDFIASITLVHRYLRTQPENTLDSAEAYYLLGVSESYVSHSYWFSETDYLLERSIRTAPKSKVAKEALAFLEDYRRSGYDVTPARPVPLELQTNIDELRKLTEQ